MNISNKFYLILIQLKKPNQNKSSPPVSSSLVVDGTTGVISDSSISFVTAGSAATGASLKDYFM